jgi:superfamily II DNA or RNA helicase
MINLRPYQEALIQGLRNAFAKNVKRVIMCLETGGGKTYTFVFMAFMHLKKPGTKVLILTDRDVLMKQAGGALRNIEMDAEYLHAGNKCPNFNKVLFVGMVETFYKRLQKDSSFKHLANQITLLIIDEAHKGAFRKVIEHFPNALIIGATATPISASKKIPLNTYFEKIVMGPSTQELIEQGALMPYVHRAVSGIDDSVFQKRGGEYTDESQMKALDKHELYEGLVDLLHNQIKGKCLIFCVNIEHTLKTAKTLQDAGYNVLTLTSTNTDEEKEVILSEFNRPESQILVNCGILTAGYDNPAIEYIVLNRKIGSLPLYRQCIGRGSRPCKEIEKEKFVVIDMANNYLEHGLWDTEIYWPSIFYGLGKKKKEGVAPIKFCPKCESIIAISVKKCINCSYIFPLPPDKEKSKALTLVDVNKVSEFSMARIEYKSVSQMTLEELLIKKQVGVNGIPYPENWLINILKNRRGGLESYARLKGYDNRWVYKHKL